MFADLNRPMVYMEKKFFSIIIEIFVIKILDLNMKLEMQLKFVAKNQSRRQKSDQQKQ